MEISQTILDKYNLEAYDNSLEWLTNFLNVTKDDAENDADLAELRTEADAILVDVTNYVTRIQELENEKQELTEQLQLVTDALIEMADQVYE